ncbi:hypothetical protein FSP39_011975 [Pinctada imbricata]|uniref:Uncharacterized protein n=1 Tax=Pinctada imbricata TaxID=66713 RepID=A0AA88XND6_PINIB|nr:hypothetical protein FSP39_011975 [Pinctada imbricata]
MPSTGETRYMSIYWRNFHLRGRELTTIEHDPEKCGKAYATIYSGKDTKVADHHTFCGAGALPSHLEWEGEYATLKFHIDFSAPPIADDSFEYPEVYFRLDITSFDYDCKDSVENVVLRCNDSKRCLDDSLRCDYWFSRNCQSVRFPRDNTDTSRHPPANCFKKKVTTTTTTTPAPPPPLPDYTALYVLLTLIGVSLAFIWCCWRPGYIPWRFGRLRNAPCFHACGKCIPCCVHASPFCAFLGEYPCCRCCAEDFVTESCGHVIGPDYGMYLEFDPGAEYDKKTKEIKIPQNLRGFEFECIIVLRGMPSTGEKRFMSLYWRDFILAGPNLTTVENDVSQCGKAYVTVYNGMDTTAQEKYTLCGVGALPSHLEWEGEYITLYFYIDYRNPNLKIVPTTTTTEPPGGTTLGDENSTATTEELPTTTPVEDNFPYPEVYLRVDITSFDYECNDSVEGVVMKCNDTKRCIDDSLRCDFWFSRNCQNELFPLDNTDTSKYPPGNCYRKTTPTTTTTTPAPPAPPPDLRPLYATIGTLLGLLLLFWCCWRPGYLAWRLARLRNVACFNSCGMCGPYGCCATLGACCAACSPCCDRCSSSPCTRCCRGNGFHIFCSYRSI